MMQTLLISPKFVISVIREGEDISQQLSDAITEGPLLVIVILIG